MNELTIYTLQEHMALESAGFQYQPHDDCYAINMPNHTYVVYKFRAEDTDWRLTHWWNRKSGTVTTYRHTFASLLELLQEYQKQQGWSWDW